MSSLIALKTVFWLNDDICFVFFNLVNEMDHDIMTAQMLVCVSGPIIKFVGKMNKESVPQGFQTFRVIWGPLDAWTG